MGTLLSTGMIMKATLRKNSSILTPLAAYASIALFCVPAKAGPPFLYRGGPRQGGSSISVGISTGPVYRYDNGYRYRTPYYAGPRYYNSAPYCPPPAVYVAPPVYAPPVYAPPVYAPPVYAAPPVYQGLPASSANYGLLAPSGNHLVAHVQEKLRGYGYYRGAVDGLTGAGTRSAIRAYQVDRGIRVTGRIDEELLSDLGL